MKLVKYNPVFQGRESMSDLFDHFFQMGWPGSFRSETTRSMPSVNVGEFDDKFEIEVAAPGLKKEDFEILVEDNHLTIRSEKKMEKEDQDDHFTRREFSYSNFSRSFYLPDSVNAENIQARYEDGILRLSLPKKEEALKISKTIDIA